MTPPTFATVRRRSKWRSWRFSQSMYRRPICCQRRSSPSPLCAPTQWYQMVMPLAAVWSIQISASALDLATFRQRTAPQVDQAPVTLVTVRPFMTAVATLPCSAAPLVVAVEPLADFREPPQVRSGADAAAEVGEEEVLRLLLLGYLVVEPPQVGDALVELAPVFRRLGRGQLAALVAVADRQAVERRPGIREEPVDVVAGLDLAHDRGHVFGEIA